MASIAVPPPEPIAPRRLTPSSELVRWFVLVGLGLWLLHPFFTSRKIGTGDAVWYSHMLADFVAQWRAGYFPVFAGQTDYAFNGAVYPLRVAPLFQHLAGIIDLLTGRHLGFYSLQHAVVIVCGLLGLVTSYLALTNQAPRQRWSAVGFSILYLSCPGVLGTVYTQDLYMTWTTIPFLPVAGWGLGRSYLKDDGKAQALIAIGLGGLWLGHAPIAMWTTAVIAASQIIRLGFIHRRRDSWKRALAGAALAGLLAHYPFVSLSSLHVPGETAASAGGLVKPEQILLSLHHAFPAAFLPLSAGAAQLSDLQLGYGLCATLLASVITGVALRNCLLILLGATGAALLLILIPIPGFSELFWLKLLPQSVQSLTYYWPMQRLYPVLAAILALAGQIAFAICCERKPSLRRMLACGLAVGCLWSLSESRQFIAAGNSRTATEESSELSERPENRLLMNHAYGLFSRLPAYFSHGVVDPLKQFRLLDRETQHSFEETQLAAAISGKLEGSLDANPGILNLSPKLQLQPEKRYTLQLTFNEHSYQGILQIVGSKTFREYSLPHSGEAKAFGKDPDASHTVDLWTTSDRPEEIMLRFIPTGAGESPEDYAHFADYQLIEDNPLTEPIHVATLMPLTATVTTNHPAWLETPRVYIPQYNGTVNGRTIEVKKSPQGLVMVPVEQGKSEIRLCYDAPLTVQIAYWLSLIAWTIVLGTVLAIGIKYIVAALGKYRMQV